MVGQSGFQPDAEYPVQLRLRCPSQDAKDALFSTAFLGVWHYMLDSVMVHAEPEDCDLSNAKGKVMLANHSMQTYIGHQAHSGLWTPQAELDSPFSTYSTALRTLSCIRSKVKREHLLLLH